MISKILVLGAGVLGSLYAGKLSLAGYNVTLLARGKRLEELQEHGLRLIKDGCDQVETVPLQITNRLDPSDAYDLVLVIVRKNQLDAVLPMLAANTNTPNVLFLVNNAEGPQTLMQTIGASRVLLGFPGAGGQRSDGLVRYRVTGKLIQPTTLGEVGGQKSERLTQIAKALKKAGFPVVFSRNMDAWLKTHVSIVSPVANALYLTRGSNYRLARTPDGLILMVRAVKEGLHVLKALRIPITPNKYQFLAWLPERLLIPVLKIGFYTPQAELVLARHANAARDEMHILAEEFDALARESGVPTPNLDLLARSLDPDYPTMPEGQTTLKMTWA
mgnify:CR=1 FL=1